jgi:hypothetical protein
VRRAVRSLHVSALPHYIFLSHASVYIYYILYIKVECVWWSHNVLVTIHGRFFSN